MASSIVSNSKPSTKRGVQPITFTQDDVVGVHYPHYDTLDVSYGGSKWS